MSELLLSGAVGVLIGAVATSYLSNMFQKLREKREHIRRLAGHSYALDPEVSDPEPIAGFNSALNEIPIVFGDDQQVMDALLAMRLKDDVSMNLKLQNLIDALCRNARITLSDTGRTFISQPFYR